MKIYREERYVVFDFEDGKTCKYNMKTRECIGKRGRPVKDLRKQLAGVDVIEAAKCAEDEDFKKIMKWFSKTYMKYNNVIQVLDAAVIFGYINLRMLLDCEVEGLNNWL